MTRLLDFDASRPEELPFSCAATAAGAASVGTGPLKADSAGATSAATALAAAASAAACAAWLACTGAAAPPESDCEAEGGLAGAAGCGLGGRNEAQAPPDARGCDGATAACAAGSAAVCCAFCASG